jgi:hypothetical protein
VTAPVEQSPCVLCGAEEPLGLSLCPGCGGAAHAVGDTLVFVRRSESRADARRVDQSLATLLAGRAHVSERGLVAAGHRALIRVPAAAAETAVRHLALRGVPAEARSARWAGTSAPWSFYLVVTSVLVVGTAAGLDAEPMLRWMSPLYAALLIVTAQVWLKRPALTTPRRRSPFPRCVERALAATFAQLPHGSARDLLAGLARAAEPLHDPARRPDGRRARRDVEQLLILACRAAVDLADLEVGLDALGDGPGARRLAGLRDGLLARFRDGIHVLHRLRGEAVAEDPATQELARLIAALDQEAAAYAAARREVETLLR